MVEDVEHRVGLQTLEHVSCSVDGRGGGGRGGGMEVGPRDGRGEG